MQTRLLNFPISLTALKPFHHPPAKSTYRTHACCIQFSVRASATLVVLHLFIKRHDTESDFTIVTLTSCKDDVVQFNEMVRGEDIRVARTVVIISQNQFQEARDACRIYLVIFCTFFDGIAKHIYFTDASTRATAAALSSYFGSVLTSEVSLSKYYLIVSFLPRSLTAITKKRHSAGIEVEMTSTHSHDAGAKR